MDFREISLDFTEDGKLRLLSGELNLLQELVDAGDRGAFHFVYGEMANNGDSLLTAKIATFSDTVGGTAFASNWALQQTESNYEGIYRISQKIASDILSLIRTDAEAEDGGTGYLTDTEHFESAEDTWASYGLSDLFPGNLINLIRNESDLGFWEEAADIGAFLIGRGSIGEGAALWGAMMSGYTGKKLTDYVGVAGYEILDVAGGKVVIDSDGRTTATFVNAGADDLLAEAARGFTLGSAFSDFNNSAENIFSLMGNVGSSTEIQSPFLVEYAEARRDFTQYSGGNYNGDNNPNSFPSVGSPTVSISHTTTAGRDLLMFTDNSEEVSAGGGDDVVMLAEGNDRAFGQEGDDIIWGQQGSDQLDGGEGDDILRGGTASDVLYGGEGDDTLDGGDITIEGYELSVGEHYGDEILGAIAGHDLLMGGTGNDLITGGFGADLLFDRGLETYTDDQIDLSLDNTELYAYEGGDDGEGGVRGSDTLVGGAGSDFMVYSGGRDDFYGGTGDDTYLVSPELINNREFGFDELTIHLEENANDETTWFGHDYVIGDGYGIHEIVFEGLNRDDVTFTYEYEETLFDELSAETQTQFIASLGVETLDIGTYPIFSLSGQLSITVNATGSSIYFDNVSGAYVAGDNSINGNIYVEPILFTQTYAVFEDGYYFDWARELDLIDFVQPINGTIDEDADDAPETQGDERSTEPPEEDPEEQTGTDDTDFLVGTFANENLNGLEGDDYLHGGDGDDLLTGGTGADLIHGGDGFDTVNYSDATSAVSVSLSSGTGSSGEAAGDQLISIEGVRGSEYGDTINGDNETAANVLEGLAGNDRLVTGFGDFDSFLYGGAGDDDLIVRGGNALLDGGEGNDQFFGSLGVDLMYGGGGDDILTLDMGNDLYDGGDGYDILTSEFIFSSLADRYIDLAQGFAQARYSTDASIGIGTNQLVSIEGYIGGSGIDIVFGTDGANLLNGGNSNDELNGAGGNDTLYGGRNDDVLRGGDGDDALYGGSENNSTSTGSDTIFGGSGTDTAYYNDTFEAYTFSTQDGVLFVTHSGGDVDEIASDVELITFTNGAHTWADLAAIMVNGEPIAGNDVLAVTEGETVTLDPRLNDSDPDGNSLSIVAINGNAFGPNTTSYTGPSLDLAISMTTDGELSFAANDPFGSDLAPGETYLATITYTVSDGLGGFADADITVTVTGAGVVSNTDPVAVSDSLTVAEDQVSEINVLANDSDPDGDPLSVTMVGGEAISVGNPITLMSGAIVALLPNGALSYDPNGAFESLEAGETATETIAYTVSDGEGGVADGDLTVTITGVSDGSGGVVNGTTGGDIIDGTFVDADGDTINSLDQVIEGLSGNDQIYDGGGNDTVSGGDDRDLFFAGGGADIYDGGADRDEVFYTTSAGGLTVSMIDSAASTGIAAGDTFIDVEYLHGSEHNDILISTAERTFGRDGDDVLEDGAGAQLFYGGNGSDVFRFTDDGGQQDRINDFTLGADVLDLSIWGVTGLDDPGLVIEEQTNGQGTPQGRLLISYGGDSIRLDGLDASDIAALEADLDHFIFAGGGGGPTGGGTFAGATIDGTASNDIIDASFVDTDGESVSEGGQTILGGAGDDRIYDGAGDDLVFGGDDRDYFYAGDGADAYDGGADRDEVFYTTATSGLTIDMTDAANSTGIATGDTFSNIEFLRGSDFDDIIIADAERVFGQGGDDMIQDAVGAQRLFGGAGSDTFRFALDGGQQDRVDDFTLGEDVFDLSIWGVTGLDDAGLTIEEQTNGQGILQGRLLISYNGDSIRVDGLAAADIAALEGDLNHFVFV